MCSYTNVQQPTANTTAAPYLHYYILRTLRRRCSVQRLLKRRPPRTGHIQRHAVQRFTHFVDRRSVARGGGTPWYDCHVVERYRSVSDLHMQRRNVPIVQSAVSDMFQYRGASSWSW